MIQFFTVKVLAWIAGGLFAVICGLLIVIVLQDAALTRSNAALKVAALDLREARATAAQWKASASECSDNTQRLVAEGKANRDEAAKAVARAQAEAAKYKPAHDRLEALRRLPTPAGRTAVKH